jgi:hypothetical protein
VDAGGGDGEGRRDAAPRPRRHGRPRRGDDERLGPVQGSVAQRTAEAKARDIFRYHPRAPERLSYTNKAERRQIHRRVYRGSPWVDLDAIEAEAAELLESDPGQAERYFGNRIVAGHDKAFDVAHYRTLAKTLPIAPGRKVTAFFDGAIRWDHTGIVIADIETGHQAVLGWWPRPPALPDDEEWRISIEELDETVETLFTTWDVWRLNADPPYYREDVSRWAGRYGDDRVGEWWTANRKQTAYALREFRADMGGGENPAKMSHGPLILSEGDEPDERALEAHEALMQHVGNAVRVPTNMRDEETGSFLWLIGKDGSKSPRKIDLAICAAGSWATRSMALRAGVLEQKTYGRASWSGGATAGKPKRVDRSNYLPCRDCQKPIHPALHEPGRSEQGLCMKCRSGR